LPVAYSLPSSTEEEPGKFSEATFLKSSEYSTSRSFYIRSSFLYARIDVVHYTGGTRPATQSLRILDEYIINSTAFPFPLSRRRSSQLLSLIIAYGSYLRLSLFPYPIAILALISSQSRFRLRVVSVLPRILLLLSGAFFPIQSNLYPHSLIASACSIASAYLCSCSFHPDR
jgi:hypothetical protein